MLVMIENIGAIAIREKQDTHRTKLMLREGSMFLKVMRRSLAHNAGDGNSYIRTTTHTPTTKTDIKREHR